MLDKIKTSFDSGIDRLKWFSNTVNERLRVEIAMVGLMRDAREHELRRAELMKEIGERVFELRSRMPQYLDDELIRRTVSELDGVERELNDIKKRASDLGRIER